ncbi:hypothetical protein [Thalassobellus citreus]|uniref:hypothetical protein n=1 Tax=Thalassobellus citreus TaxID=3367752 RepID=UPI003794AB79
MKKIFLLVTLLFSLFATSQVDTRPPQRAHRGIHTKLIQPYLVTTAQRDALTPTKGTILYHEDTGVSQWEQWNGTTWEALKGSLDNIYTINGTTPDGSNRYVDLGTGSSMAFRSPDFKTYYYFDDDEIDIRNGYGTLRFRTGSGGTYDANSIGDVWTATSTSGNGHWAAPSDGTTNLGYISTATNGTITSSTGTNAVIGLANNSNAGLLSPAEQALIYSALQPAVNDTITANWTINGVLRSTISNTEVDSIGGDAFIPKRYGDANYLRDTDLSDYFTKLLDNDGFTTYGSLDTDDLSIKIEGQSVGGSRPGVYISSTDRVAKLSNGLGDAEIISTDVGGFPYINLNSSRGTWLRDQLTIYKGTVLSSTGSLTVDPANITAARSIVFQDKDYAGVADLSDIPSVVPTNENLLFSDEAKAELKSRFQNGYTAGTGFADDITKIITEKDNFIANPSQYRPTLGSAATVPNNRQWLHTTAAYAYALDDVSIANTIATEILAYVGANDLNTTWWNDSSTYRFDADYSLWIQTADVKKTKHSYNLIKDLATNLTDVDKETIDTWFARYAEITFNATSSRIETYLGVDWENAGITKFTPEGTYPEIAGVSTANPLQDSNGDDITAYTMAWAQDIYNNRQWEAIAYVHSWAIENNDREKEIWARNFVKSFLKYAIFPDGTMAELYRNVDSDPTKGVFYGYITMTAVVSMAHEDAVANNFPNDKLYDYTTKEGIVNGSTNLTTSGFAGGSTTDGITEKSILSVLKAQSNYLRTQANGGWSDLRYFKKTDNSVVSLSTVGLRQPSTIPAIANLYYRNTDLSDWYNYNTSVGYPAKVIISEGYLAGVDNEDTGAWGNLISGSLWYGQENNYSFQNDYNEIKTIQNDLEVKGTITANDAINDNELTTLNQLNESVYGSLSSNLYNTDTKTSGKFISNTTGSLTTNAAYDTSDFIPVTEGLTYTSNTAMRFTCYFDDSFVVVSGGSNSNISTFTVPAGVNYVRVTIPVANEPTFILSEGLSTPTYEAYTYLIPQKSTGTTANRPTSPNLGDTHFNTDTQKTEEYTSSGWVNIDNSSSGLANLTEVATLAELQAVVNGTSTITRIVSITGVIDIGNTDVALSNVYLTDGGGSIISTGTGELELLGDSYVDNTILNYQLNWASTTNAFLKNPSLTFDTRKYPIDETISTSISFSDVTPTIIANTQGNIDNINKAISDTKLLNGNELFISKLDCFIQNSRPATGTWYEKNLNDQHLYSIILPSDFTIRMTDAVFIRSLPSYAYAQHIISSEDTKNVKVIGGNLIGSRLSHNYRQYRRIYTPSTASSIDYTIGENDALVTYTIPITPNDAETQVEEISNYINASTALGALGYSSTWGTNEGHWYFDISNSTDGLYFRAYASSTGVAVNGYTEYLSGYDITYELAIAYIGVDGGLVDGAVLKDCYGDGFVAAGNSLSTDVGFRNCRNIAIKNCTIDNNRRNNISPIGVDTMVIENNYIINAGQDMGVNDGSAPRYAIDTEPTRYRDATTGETLDENIVRGVVVRNNYMLDNLYGSVNLFSAYDSWAYNNVVNTRMAAYKLQGGGLIDNVIDYNLTLGGAVHSIGQTGIETNAVLDTWTNKIEIASEIIIRGNIIRGKGDDATLEEKGMRLQGWKLNVSDNVIKNINGIAFDLSSLRDSNIHNNIVDNETNVTGSLGLEVKSAAVRDVYFTNNNIRTYGRALELNNMNTTAQASAINMTVGAPSLFINDNVFESYNDNARLITTNSITLKDNLFKNQVQIRNTNTDLYFKGNTVKDGLFISASSAILVNASFIDNDVYSTSTSAAIEFDNTGASDNIVFENNRLYQNSNGSRAFWVTNSGVQPDNLVLMNNKLMEGSPTEFITFTGDNSLIKNNYDIPSRSASSQTITGTGNTVE